MKRMMRHDDDDAWWGWMMTRGMDEEDGWEVRMLMDEEE